MWRCSVAISLVALGCSASSDDGPAVDTGSAGSTDPTGGPGGGDAMASIIGTGGTSAMGGSGGTSAMGGAGGGSGGAAKDGGPASSIVVTVAPKSTAVIAGQSLQLVATVTGSADTAVAWSVVEGAGCGTVSMTGDYTAPATAPNPAYCHVKAASHADAAKSDTATLDIVLSGSTGQIGIWENVTPAGVTLDPTAFSAGNFGVQDVVADPVRPSDFYVGICYQGFWRSTDFGRTWKKVSTGTNGDVLAGGRPWSAAIDDDKGRDPMVAPALYTTDGYGSKNGVFKSTDWGVSWTISGAGLSPYSFDMDPYDNQHLVTGLHEAEGLAETTDGGVTWKNITTSIGKSIYPHFIDTGAAATTRKTWLAVSKVATGT